MTVTLTLHNVCNSLVQSVFHPDACSRVAMTEPSGNFKKKSFHTFSSIKLLSFQGLHVVRIVKRSFMKAK